MTKKNHKKKSQKSRDNQGKKVISEKALDRLEFHRHALALMPELADKDPGVVFFVEKNGRKPSQKFCTCSASKRKTCRHILTFARLYKISGKKLEGKWRDDDFRSSIWHGLAAIMAEGSHETTQSVRLHFVRAGDKKIIKALDSRNMEIFFYLSSGPDHFRFIERLGKTPRATAMPNRGDVIEKLALLALTENERTMLKHGVKTRRQVLEESLWYRVAYHCHREFGSRGCTFHPAVNELSGDFTLTCRTGEEKDVFRLIIPRRKVKRLITTLEEKLLNQHKLAIHPVPLRSIFKVSMKTKLDLELRPLIQLIQENGEARFFEREDFERFRYGNLIYIKELNILAELEQPEKMERKFKSPVKMVLKKSQVPSFLEEFEEELQKDSYILDTEVKGLQIFRQFDKIEISPGAIDKDWCWLSIKYGFGNTLVSLSDILHAKKEAQRFIGTPDGWIDCQALAFGGLDSLIKKDGPRESENNSETIRLSRMELLRITTDGGQSLSVTGKDNNASLLKQIIELKPSRHFKPLKGMTSSLRSYQKLGVEWIRFLFENGFGGLLCDDMGLGKTHQVMAFMLGLREHEDVKEPFLVVCPTTVLSHWRDKIRVHVPSLKVEIYHGEERDPDEAVRKNDVLLTSYGLLRRDIDRLKGICFSMAVFDEAQYLKNPETLSYKAAVSIKALMKLGLTGTPIENKPGELKALLDLTVPGYMGNDEEFENRFAEPAREDIESPGLDKLSRIISPFTLRRMKKTVLSELPEKIEDIRLCLLSEDQIKFYRDAISLKGDGLILKLREREKPVPFIHVFALLALLKQICDHPALINGDLENYNKYESGKWDLFKELMTEGLESGQKVVVFSQFIGMIKIIESFLKEKNVGFVTLTGVSRNRGEIISRFNNDPDCRVYVGSLKAGGTGVDLVAGSVVIHYDRWWNAAKEDQATDRVHRIGQKRGVQVFKLVTEGTLEEKISAIIERKRNLMDKIIKEDDPGIMKTFSREQLIEMLSGPS